MARGPRYLPGEALTSRNRLIRMLRDQERAAPPIESHTQGLAHVLRQGLIGYQAGQDARERSEAHQAMIDGLTATPWVDPDTGKVAPGQKAVGGYRGAEAALARMPENEYAQLLMPNVSARRIERDQQVADRDEGYRRQDERFAAQQQAADARFDRQFAAQSAERQRMAEEQRAFREQQAAEDREFRRQMAQFAVDNRAPGKPTMPFALGADQFGRPILVNRMTGETTPVESLPQSVPGASGDSAPVSNYEGDMDYSVGTGASGFFGQAANTVSDLFGQGSVFPDIERASQALTNLRIRTQTALQAPIAGRPSNYLMQELAKLTVSPGNLAQADSRSAERLQQTQQMIVNEIARLDGQLAAPDPSFSRNDIATIRQNRSQLESLRNDYDKVLQNFNASAAPAGDATGVPPGVDAEDWRYMTPQERALWQGGQ